MPSELIQAKELVEGLTKSFEDFKKSNDERLKEIEKKGHADPLLESKVTKHNEALDKMEKSVEDIKLALNRRTSGSETPDPKELDKKEAAVMTKIYKGKGLTAEEKQIYKEIVTQNYSEVEEAKTLSADINIDGGYFVRPQVDARINKKIFESSPMRALAESMSISANSLEFPYDDDQPDSEWLGERQSPTDPTDNNEISMLTFQTHILSAQPRASQTLLDDASLDIEAWHAGKVAEKFGRAEATSFISGSGVGQPKGILSYASGTSFGQLEQVNSGHATTLTADGLHNLQNALFEEFQGGAVFLMQRATALVVRKLKDNNGRYLWSVDNGLLGAQPANLLGRPVHFAADMQADGVASNLPIAYGNFKIGYLIVDRVGVRVLRDPYTSKPFVKFYTTKRVGGGVQQFQAIKLQKLSA